MTDGNTPLPSLAAAEPLHLVGAMQSHPGRIRDNNEDFVAYVLPRPDDAFARNGALALVADGLGGHNDGETASRLAVDIIRRRFYEIDGPVPQALADGFAAANRAIYERAAPGGTAPGMGTTCTAFAVRDGLAYLAHIGDSRAYLLRGGALRQISQDHSVIGELVNSGVITADEAARSPYRYAVSRALGTQPIVEPLIWREGMALAPEDVVLLCTDGLSDALDSAAIVETIGRLAPAEACVALIDAALARGGRDNVSVGIFAVRGGAAPTLDPLTRTRLVPVGGPR